MANPTKSLDCRVGTAHQSRLNSFCSYALTPLRPYALTHLCTCALLLFLITSPAYAKYGGGTGEPNDPYLIFDANHMQAIGADSNDWDKHFKLMADIDLSEFTGTSFNIIGYWVDLNSPDNKPFTGVFDGSGHTISNFSYASIGTGYIGLFGYVDDPNAEIKNLGLIDPNVDTGTGFRVGSLVGWFRDGTIANCYAEAASVTGDRWVGGLVGSNSGTITNCYSAGSVMGATNVGGLLGGNGGTITNCYSTGSVSGNYAVGGLVGVNGYGTTTDCYSSGNVWGTSSVGGLVGVNWGGITNCYSASSVEGTTDVGGLVGENYKGTVSASFWDIETSGQSSSDGGTGLPTAQMQMQVTFTDAGWGCGSVWTIDDGNDYPRLVWENMPGELITTPSYGGGNGEPNDPYQIRDANHMQAIGADANDWDKHFKLMADIDLAGFTGTEFNIIGFDGGNPFTGVFDGNDHTISNFTYTSTGINYIGLFGYVSGENAEIKDLELIDPNVDAGTESWSVGSLVGVLMPGTITNCYVDGGTVSGSGSAGGLLGDNYGTINNCYSTASVLGTGWGAGGLVGWNRRTISNCYSTASVSGNISVGGLVGYNSWGTITNCYAVGSVAGGYHSSYFGGLCGYKYKGTISNCFWDIETSGQTSSAGGTGLPTAEMQMASTFTDADWDFESVWWILEGMGYPRLCWEEKYGGGSGRPNDPYLIYTAEQMNTIGACQRDWDKHFILMADIDLAGYTGTAFNIIGYRVSSSDNKPFTGVFDGSGHTISNFTYTSTDRENIGLFGYVHGGEIKNLGLIDPNIEGGTGYSVGSLVGYVKDGTITACCVEGGSVWGRTYCVGGLVGYNYRGIISNSYLTGSVSGDENVGGLVGRNRETITNCYSSGSVSGTTEVGGLLGNNRDGTVTNCYSTGSVSGNDNVGGLVGYNWEGEVTNSFWDIETSGQATSAGGTGKTTAEMQMMSTFTDAGWDFTTPVWTIGEGVDYPRLWWELMPVLHAEPEITLGTSNTISWDPVPGANDYYAECAADANFTSILYTTGWITETSYEFTGLQLGQEYWYSVKARNIAGVETGWSNVESSLQVTLADAVAVMLDPDTLKNKNMKNALLNKINAVQGMIADGLYADALNKLRNDILQKTDGCAETGRPDKNDWIITCEEQEQIYPLIIETIENVKGLMNQ